MTMKQRYIWTHFSDIEPNNEPWTAMEIEEGEDPINTIASLGEHAGAFYGRTELEAISRLLNAGGQAHNMAEAKASEEAEGRESE